MYINISEYPILYYVHSMPAIFFDRNCGHPQGGALKGIFIVKVY